MVKHLARSYTSLLHRVVNYAHQMSKFAVHDLPVNRFFFIRHAQSLGNVRGVFHSNKADWILTKLGHEQAKRAVPVLNSLPVQSVLSSPLKRVQQTLEPYLDDNDHINIKDDRLIERDFAGIEGMPIPLERNFFIEDPDGVEPTTVFIERIINALKDGLKQDDILFGAHAGVMHGLSLGLGIDMDPWAGPYNNATPTILEKQNGAWSLQYWSFSDQDWRKPPPASRDWSV